MQCVCYVHLLPKFISNSSVAISCTYRLNCERQPINEREKKKQAKFRIYISQNNTN